MAVLKITKDNFQKEVVESSVPVLVDFWAPWCGPCKMLGPVVEEFAAEKSDIKVGKVNVDEEPEIASKFGITGIPTLIVFEDGKVKNTSVGVISKEQMAGIF